MWGGDNQGEWCKTAQGKDWLGNNGLYCEGVGQCDQEKRIEEEIKTLGMNEEMAFIITC